MTITFNALEKKERNGLITLEGYYIIQANSLFNDANIHQINHLALCLGFYWENSL